jgi:peptidoglycan/LPS O-acetylase OafA/YrhL
VNARHRYYPQLDGLRGVAIAMVVFGHVAHFTFGLDGAWSSCAGAGVLIFFVLSGFLITDILLGEIESSGSLSFRNFYARRCLRLLPALFLFLLAMLTLKLLGLFSQDSWGAFAASALYLRNIFGSGDGTAHLWSLSLEEQFYLTWPILLLLMKRRRLSSTFALLVAWTAWRVIAIHFRLANNATGALYERPWFRYDSILYGCFLAIALRAPDGIGVWRSRASLIFHPILTLPLLVASSTITETSKLFPISMTVQSMLAAGAILGVITCSERSVLHRVLASVPARFVGRISYSLYLWQQPFLVIRQPSWGGLRTFPIDVGVAIVLAVFSYYAIERPFLALKARFGPT